MKRKLAVLVCLIFLASGLIRIGVSALMIGQAQGWWHFDGEAAVRSYFAASREPFPDQANEIIAIAVDAATDTVLVEFWLTGTHLGPLKLGLRTVEPTGKAFRIRMAASFEFAPGSDRIVCERPYYDQSAVMKALGLL